MNKYPKAVVIPAPPECPEGSVLIGESSLVTVTSAIPDAGKAFRVGSSLNLIEPRSVGNLRGHSFYLYEGYNWTIVKDSRDCLVLVPTR